MIRWIAVCLALLVLSGCAGRRGGGAAGTGPEAADGSIRLPGQDRIYPSEDPRNRPPPGQTRIWMPEPATIGAPADGGAVGADPAGGEEAISVQVLATVDRRKAEELRESLAGRLGLPARIVREQEIWKVRVGSFEDLLAAEALRRRLIGLGYDDAFLVGASGR